MMPLTNSQIAAQAREAAAKYGTKNGATAPAPVMLSHNYGPYALVWVGNPAIPVEVRDASGSVLFRGTREECAAWLRRRGYDAS